MGNAFSDLGLNLGASAPGIGMGSTTTSTTDPLQAQAPPDTNVSTTPGAQPAPTLNLASGVGQILLFPGKTIVSQFVGTGDPLDTSHLPITVLLSAAAWYGLYWYFFQRGSR